MQSQNVPDLELRVFDFGLDSDVGSNSGSGLGRTPSFDRMMPRNSGRSLDDATRSHILQTLREANRVIGGRNGAASRLGIRRTTLIAKMRRLGIESPRGVVSAGGRIY